MELHLEIHAGKDKDGCIKVDCHWGTKTVLPHGFATCVTDSETLDDFLKEVREMIVEETS